MHTKAWTLKRRAGGYNILVNGKHIMNLDGPWYPSPAEVTIVEANARLIAAAPEQNSALIDLVTLVKRIIPDADMLHEVQNADEAIRKAKESSMKKKVKYISVYHHCRNEDAEYHIRFNRGDKPADTPRYKNPTLSSINRVAKLFYRLECLQATLLGNYVHLQAYTKGE
jgi:hypothetical protein